MYDIMEQGYLDLLTLRQLLKKGFTHHIVNLEEAMLQIKSCVVKVSDSNQFSESNNQF